MKERILTAAIAGAGFLALLYFGGAFFAGLVVLMAIVGISELVKMLGIPKISLTALLVYVFVSLLILWPILTNETTGQIQLHILITAALLLFTAGVLTKNKLAIDRIGALFIGIVYVGFGFYSILYARDVHGFAYVLFILILIWSTDSGAYFTGRSIGKRKLWPEISPKKTIEGAIGGIISAILVAIIFYFIFPLHEQIYIPIVLALFVGIAGQLGDLVESAVKRFYNVKDSGTLLPGHGGILDRFDSMLFVFPILYILGFI